MKKTVVSLFVLTLLLFSCEKENNEVLSRLSVKITSEKEVDNYADFQVKMTELKSGQSYMSKANEEGVALFEIPMGAYSIVAENLKDGVSTLYGINENFVLEKDNAELTIKVESIINSLKQSFVLDELYFNGAKNGTSPTMYEQYFTIRNISDRALYADGLSFGVCGDFNTLDQKNEMSKLLPDVVVLSQFYTIPGGGRTYKVEPNKSIVIAHSAVNHNESGDKPKSLDLSGADFEIYVDSEWGSMTPDNPEVPNVKVNFSTFQAFHWQYSGAAPMVLFRLDEAPKTFIKKNKQIFENPASMGVMKQDFIKLPSKYIIDAVETGVKDAFYHKVLPVSVDKSSFQIPGTSQWGSGFEELFIQRKEISGDDGKLTVKDTNDSENDYVLKKGGQKSYPKKK